MSPYWVRFSPLALCLAAAPAGWADPPPPVPGEQLLEFVGEWAGKDGELMDPLALPPTADETAAAAEEQYDEQDDEQGEHTRR